MHIRLRQGFLKAGLATASFLLCLLGFELFLRLVYDPLEWLASDQWQQKLYEAMYQRDGIRNQNPDPDVKHTFGGTRRDLPLPYASYRRYLKDLYEPASGGLNYVHQKNINLLLDDPSLMFPMRLRTNSLGLRDEEIPPVKPSREVRILFVGDSVTFGPGVDDEELFVEQLESLLQKTARGDWRASVINYGVGGYNLWQELALLKATHADRLDPDLMLVGVVLNDDGESNSFIEWNDVLAALGHNSMTARIQAALGQSLRVMRLALWGAHTARDMLRESRSVDSPVTAEDVTLKEEGCQWLHDLNTYAADIEIPLGYVVFPQEYQFAPGHEYYETTSRKYELWHECALETGRPVFDLHEHIEEQATGSVGSISRGLYVRWDSIHLNPAGHRLVAQNLHDFVMDNWDLPAMAVPAVGGVDR